MIDLPKTATAPFCPTEISGTVAVNRAAPGWKKIFRFLGPGLLVSIGYMDPGNWATSVEAGSQFGYSLLFVVVLSSLSAIVLQCLCSRLGLATGKDLAVHCREHYSPWQSRFLWIIAEISIVACDLAEVLGCALAFKLLLGVSLPVGILLTVFDTLIVLALRGKGFRQLEAIIMALFITIAVCMTVELIWLKPDWSAVLHGSIPSLQAINGQAPLYLAIGILGATIMPHNLYLHSSIVQTRLIGDTVEEKRTAIRYCRVDTIVSLLLALLVNAAILIVAASAFHEHGYRTVTDLDDAYRLLEPIAGAGAAILFGLALLAAGQSSTLTGTLAGQVIMDGFIRVQIPCWLRRFITRGLALIPALIGVLTLGEHSVGRLLVLSQVVLSMQLPFAMYPLLRMTSDPRIMKEFVNNAVTKWTAWLLFLVIFIANTWLISQFFINY